MMSAPKVTADPVVKSESSKRANTSRRHDCVKFSQIKLLVMRGALAVAVALYVKHSGAAIAPATSANSNAKRNIAGHNRIQ